MPESQAQASSVYRKVAGWKLATLPKVNPPQLFLCLDFALFAISFKNVQNTVFSRTSLYRRFY